MNFGGESNLLGENCTRSRDKLNTTKSIIGDKTRVERLEVKVRKELRKGVNKSVYLKYQERIQVVVVNFKHNFDEI